MGARKRSQMSNRLFIGRWNLAATFSITAEAYNHGESALVPRVHITTMAVWKHYHEVLGESVLQIPSTDSVGDPTFALRLRINPSCALTLKTPKFARKSVGLPRGLRCLVHLSYFFMAITYNSGDFPFAISFPPNLNKLSGRSQLFFLPG